MDNFWVTYSSVIGSSAKVEALLLKTPTHPCKLTDNHKVINLDNTRIALPHGSPSSLVCNAFFVYRFLNN